MSDVDIFEQLLKVIFERQALFGIRHSKCTMKSVTSLNDILKRFAASHKCQLLSIGRSLASFSFCVLSFSNKLFLQQINVKKINLVNGLRTLEHESPPVQCDPIELFLQDIVYKFSNISK